MESLGSDRYHIVDVINNELQHFHNKHKIEGGVNAVLIKDPYSQLHYETVEGHGWHKEAACKMIVLSYQCSVHRSGVFVFNNAEGKKHILFLNPDLSDIKVIDNLEEIYIYSDDDPHIIHTEQLQNDRGLGNCGIFTIRLLTDFYKCWVLASMDPNKVEDAELRDKILHAKKVHDAQLDLFQKAIDNGKIEVELVPAFMKLKQSAQNLPEGNTDVGILHNTEHAQFHEKNFVLDVQLNKERNLWASHRRVKIDERLKSAGVEPVTWQRRRREMLDPKKVHGAQRI